MFPVFIIRQERRDGNYGGVKLETGILVLGYNPKEPNWEQVIWGTPDKPGRLVKAIAVIIEQDPSIIVISGGESEAKRMKERLYQGLKQLNNFSGIYPVLQNVSSREIQRKLDKILKLEETASDTIENMTGSGAIFAQANVESVTIVTSPDHCPRAFRDARIHWGKSYPELAKNVSVTGSESLYSMRTLGDQKIAKMENVVIAEPPVMETFNLARIFGILGSPDALSEVYSVLKKYGR